MRSCIFCGNPAGTLEHAWPLWLMRKFSIKANAVMEGQIGEGDLLHFRQMNPELKVRFVCKDCNNGWMSRLEDQVIPIIEPVFNRKPIIINPEEQSILATWSIKTAIVLESIHHRHRFYLPSERFILKETLKPPDHTYVWIAACVNHNACYSSASMLIRHADETTKTINGYASTMAFGSLVLQVLTIRLPNYIPYESVFIDELQSESISQATIRIWPIQNIPQKWPPSLGLNGEDGLEALRTRWVHASKT